MSKTSLVANGTKYVASICERTVLAHCSSNRDRLHFRHQEAHVSVHSKWTAASEKDKFSGFKSAGQSNDSKRGPGSDNAWGPLFKSRSHFNEMHMF